MIRAYDEYGNVVDLVEWEANIRKEEREKVIDECISILEIFTKGTTRESFNWVEIWRNLWVAFKQLKGKEE